MILTILYVTFFGYPPLWVGIVIITLLSLYAISLFIEVYKDEHDNGLY